MAPGHGLRGLQVGETGHDPIGARLGLRQSRADQRGEAINRRVALIAHPQPEIGRHLVVARPARVQAACGLADDLLQAGLHVHVDVLQVGAEGELARLDL